jgi:hypothetical protein
MTARRVLIGAGTMTALLLLGLLAIVRATPVWGAIEPSSGAPPGASPSGGSPGASPAIIAPDCPPDASQVSTSGGLAVCVDRGEGATYTEGDRITVCVAANVPTIAIYPPPPPPTIRVVNIAANGSSRVLLEDDFAEGHRCLSGTIAAPIGRETVRAQAIRADGTPFLEDTVTFTTRPR